MLTSVPRSMTVLDTEQWAATQPAVSVCMHSNHSVCDQNRIDSLRMRSYSILSTSSKVAQRNLSAQRLKLDGSNWQVELNSSQCRVVVGHVVS